MRALATIFALIIIASAEIASAEPLYFVGGERVSEIRSIEQSNILSLRHLEPSEAVIAEYGLEAAEGVVLIELHQDSEPIFSAEQSFRDYIESTIAWRESDPAARVVAKLIIAEDGSASISEIMESTDSRLRRRVIKAIEESPKWQPATKGDKPIESQTTVCVELPKGKKIAAEKILTWR
ncbi:MAG: TonB-dependent receptor [Rikenellaceae bacterium]